MIAHRALRWIASLPGWVTAGAACGLMAGLAVGAIAPFPGMVLGSLLGVGAGAAAGGALRKEERKREARDRELDDIIGVTSGNLGACPESLRAAFRKSVEDVEEDGASDPLAARAWLDEWLTPPPPALG